MHELLLRLGAALDGVHQALELGALGESVYLAREVPADIHCNGADALILDLEDAVAASAKAKARELMVNPKIRLIVLDELNKYAPR